MHVNISGHQMSVGKALEEYSNARLQEVVSKYFANAPGVDVYFSKGQNQIFNCDIVLHEGTGRHVVIKSNSSCDDAYSAFDLSLSRLQKQMRKYRSKLNNHHRGVKTSELALSLGATKYVISPQNKENEEEYNIDNPVIVAEKTTQIHSLSVGEAVMRMDLENLPALMFENSKTGRMNVVYYRKDGNISWVDSQDKK